MMYNKPSSANRGDNDHCQIDLAQPAIYMLKDMKNGLPRYMTAAREQYAEELQALISTKEYVARTREVQDLVMANLGGKFTPALVRRVLR